MTKRHLGQLKHKPTFFDSKPQNSKHTTYLDGHQFHQKPHQLDEQDLNTSPRRHGTN